MPSPPPLIITIGNTVIPIPTSGADPSWAQAWDDFALAVQNQFLTISTGTDIPATVQILSSEVNTNLPVVSAIFPNGVIRSFTLTYSVYRVSTGSGATSVVESGVIVGTYGTLNLVWVLQREYNGTKQPSGQSYQSFSMSGDQLVLNTIAMPSGTYDNIDSTISFSARTELVSIT